MVLLEQQMVQRCWTSAEEEYSYLKWSAGTYLRAALEQLGKRLSGDLSQAKAALLSQTRKAGLEDSFISAFI